MRDILKKLGLSEKEIDVYLGAFKLGTGTINNLARQSKIKRPTVYVILEGLAKKGLVKLEKKNNKQIFISQNPQKLLDLLDRKKKALLEKQERLKKVLPQFKARAKKESYVPAVRYYEGKENVWNISEDQMILPSEAWLIVSGKIFDIFGMNRMMKDVIEKRKQSGKKAYLISDHYEEMIKLWKLKEIDTREIRFVPKNIEFNATVNIYSNKVSVVFWQEPFSGIIIESKELFQVMKFMFNALWKELKGKNLPKD